MQNLPNTRTNHCFKGKCSIKNIMKRSKISGASAVSLDWRQIVVWYYCSTMLGLMLFVHINPFPRGKQTHPLNSLEFPKDKQLISSINFAEFAKMWVLMGPKDAMHCDGGGVWTVEEIVSEGVTETVQNSARLVLTVFRALLICQD